MKNVCAVVIVLLASVAMVSAAERVVVCEEMYADW